MVLRNVFCSEITIKDDWKASDWSVQYFYNMTHIISQLTLSYDIHWECGIYSERKFKSLSIVNVDDLISISIRDIKHSNLKWEKWILDICIDSVANFLKPYNWEK